MPNRTIKFKVNEKQYTNTTGSDGRFSLTVNLPPADNQPTTYQIFAMFEGDENKTAVAYATTPNGTQVPVCTTMQFGFKPSANTVSLTVEPQSTTTTQQTKTPEQMQQEAEQSGGLTIWAEFSWSYPWFRLHVRASVNPVIHIAFNPILPGGEIAEWNGLEFFNGLVNEVLQTIGIEALGLILIYLGARYTSLTSFWAGIIAEALKIGLQGFLLMPSWDNVDAMRAVSVMSFIMLVFALTDFGSIISNFVERLIDKLRWICGVSVISFMWILTKLKDMFLWGRGAASAIVDAMEIVADAVYFILAGVRIMELIYSP